MTTIAIERKRDRRNNLEKIFGQIKPKRTRVYWGRKILIDSINVRRAIFTKDSENVIRSLMGMGNPNKILNTFEIEEGESAIRLAGRIFLTAYAEKGRLIIKDDVLQELIAEIKAIMTT
jgi:hypothetical protein